MIVPFRPVSSRVPSQILTAKQWLSCPVSRPRFWQTAVPALPVPWQDFELVPLSLCPWIRAGVNVPGQKGLCSRVSNGKGQCNFLGPRDRSSFIVPGQKDNGKSSKSCQGTVRDSLSKSGMGCGTGQSLWVESGSKNLPSLRRHSLWMSPVWLPSYVRIWHQTKTKNGFLSCHNLVLPGRSSSWTIRLALFKGIHHFIIAPPFGVKYFSSSTSGSTK